MRRGAGGRQSGRVGPVAAGLMALAAVAIVVRLAFGGIPFQDGYEVRAVFREASEIHARTPVRLAGVEVGKVRRVERGPGGTAIVTMRLRDEALPLHEDATVKIRPRIFLEGNFFLDLRPGTPGTPELDEGGTLPLSQTATPVQLDQVLGTLDRATREELVALVREYGVAMEGGGGRALARLARPARDAFAGAAQVAEAARGEREGDLGALVRDGGRTAAALAEDPRALADLVTGLDRTARGLAAGDDALARSVRAAEGLLVEADPALRSLDAALPPARELLRELRPGLRELPGALELVPPLAGQLAGLLGPDELPALRRRLAVAVPELARLVPPLGGVLETVTPVTECARRNVLPVLNARIDDPPLTTGATVYQELLYSAVGLASAARNFDGNGPVLRYHAGFGDQVVTTGRAPSANEPLVGLTSEPIIGSRPRPPGGEPPLRADVPCLTQRLPDLRAQTGPAPEQRRLSGESGRPR